MKRGARIGVIAACAAGVLAAGWLAYGRLYGGPRAALVEKVRGYRSALRDRETELAQVGPLRERLRRLASTTLGSDEEQVSAALRSATSDVLASVGLRDTTVLTGRPEGVKNPAAARVEEVTDRAAKNRPDFYAVTATASGVGTLEGVLRAMATLQGQPWVHRLDQWSIAPVDKGRERFELSVGFTTVYFPEPDLRPAGALGDGQPGARAWQPLSESRFAPYRSILTRMAFKEPPPPPPAPPAGAQPTAVASVPAQPYAEWKVTAVVVGNTGEELWLTNSKSGQRTTLVKGDKVLDATFVEAAGEMATLEIGGSRFTVALGQTLADRRAANR